MEEMTLYLSPLYRPLMLKSVDLKIEKVLRKSIAESTNFKPFMKTVLKALLLSQKKFQ